VSLLGAFIVHEVKMQLRSPRFRVLSIVYIVACSAPPILLAIAADRMGSVIGASAFWFYTGPVQALLTSMLALAIAIDALTRERDEGSLPVVSLAPITGTGYVIRRWIAIVAVLAPVTLIPRLIAYAAAAVHTHAVVSPSGFFFGWLIQIAPLLLVVSALAFALGTITSRTVLALLFGFLIFTMGLGLVNDSLARTHRTFDGSTVLFGLEPYLFDQLVASIRGWRPPILPTEAGYPFVTNAMRVLPPLAIPFAVASLFLGASTLYLRRTRPNVRPWIVPETHPFHNFVQIGNRIRNEYLPDYGLTFAERVSVVIGLFGAIAALAFLTIRFDHYAELAAERYAADQGGPAEMSTSVVPESVVIRGRIDGSAASISSDMTLRNRGPHPIAHLGFALNPALQLEVRSERGRARLERRWERIGIELDPPLAPGEARRVTFLLRGTPGEYVFALKGGRSFGQRYRRFQRATDAFELSDLSRSELDRAASGVRIVLAAPHLTPVPRYTSWTIGEDDRTASSFVPEAIFTSPAIDVRLDLSHDFLVADACGTIAQKTIVSRCTMPLNDYAIVAAPLQSAPIAPGARLAFLPAHADLARVHATALSGALRQARDAWPNLALPDRVNFVELPNSIEASLAYWYESPSARFVESHGALNLVPELTFIRKRPMDTRTVAAVLIANVLKRQRTVVPEQRGLFNGFYVVVALTRLGERSVPAVVPPMPGVPDTEPLLSGNEWRSNRLRHVLTDIEYRVGSDRLAAGISDFVQASGGAGTARELLDAIGRRGGTSLDRMYIDYFVGRAIPRLTLATVTFRKDGRQWAVSGTLRNTGDGEAICPIVLRTAAGSLRQNVRVDTNGSVPFTFITESEPRTLQLDPEKVCYRFAYIGSVDAVDYQGHS
jgi:ABC-type transport system involved in multi-copper enzyme maturation permease subunit